MTDEEAIMHYLRGHAGQEMPICKTLNLLVIRQTGHNPRINPVSRAVREKKFIELRNAMKRLIKVKMVKRHRGPRPRRLDSIRINEAYVRITGNPFYT